MEIGIIGSCASRDTFNSKIIPNYKDFFSVSCYQFQMSIISLMAKQIPFEESKFVGKATKINKDHLHSELTKNFLNELAMKRPKYIIMDFYADVIFGVIKINDSFITNKVFKFKDIQVMEDLVLRENYSPRKNFDEFFSLWEKSFDMFVQYVKTYLPESHIVINKARMTNEYFDDVNKVIKLINDQKSVNMSDVNDIWDKLDNYVVEKYSLRKIDFNGKKYYGDRNHIWELYHLHFQNNYYRDFKDKLLKIIVDDLIKQQKSTDTKSNYNLILNSTFNQGSSYWSHWNDRFKIMKSEDGLNNQVRLISENETVNKNFQIWSNAVEISESGQEYYTLSFDIKVDNLQKIDSNQMIFCIRTFDTNEKLNQSDSTEYYNLTINDFDLSDNQWKRCTFTFKPNGRYIRVAPYLLRNGSVEWKKIQLEKFEEASEWKKCITES